MTREEIKDFCDMKAQLEPENEDIFKAIVKELEQEPQSFKWCTDCKEYDQEKHCCHRYSKVIRDTVAEIGQEPKTGHWIEHPEIETSTPEYLMFYECSECGDRQCFCKSDIHKKRFCSNCGCRMVESQERSDKE